MMLNAVRYFVLVLILPVLFLGAARPASGEAEFIKLDESQSVLLMLGEINEVRMDAGLDPVILDPGLSRVCRVHSQDMVKRDFFGHFDPDGLCANDRVRRAGLNCIVTENVGVYRADGASLPRLVSDLMDGFRDSAPHLRNILDPCVTHVGIGFCQDADSDTTIFGRNEDSKRLSGYGTIFVTQNFYGHEIFETEPSVLPAEVLAGEELELSIKTVNDFDVLSLHFEKESFFSEEYFVRAEPRAEREYKCNWRFPEEGRWTCRVIGIYDPAAGLARGIGQMEFVVE